MLSCYDFNSAVGRKQAGLRVWETQSQGFAFAFDEYTPWGWQWAGGAPLGWCGDFFLQHESQCMHIGRQSMPASSCWEDQPGQLCAPFYDPVEVRGKSTEQKSYSARPDCYRSNNEPRWQRGSAGRSTRTIYHHSEHLGGRAASNNIKKKPNEINPEKSSERREQGWMKFRK